MGSVALASLRSVNCGTGSGEMFRSMHRHDLIFAGWPSFYVLKPEVLNSRMKNRKIFRAGKADKKTALAIHRAESVNRFCAIG